MVNLLDAVERLEVALDPDALRRTFVVGDRTKGR